ncbi:hypothetical protein [Xanthomarina gelatinilytica]|jgi:type IV secretory pathway VirB6-like protein|uniref:hypothetical protein n=1 Tax=Xanthomarina gelatinilytica TaxID=1137281 RepID=UPI003AA86AEA
MSRILEAFGLKKQLDFTVNSEKSKFIESLKPKVKPNIPFLFDIFDNDQKEFYGTVNENDFWLRKADRLPKSPYARAFGKVKDTFGKTEINIKIITLNWLVLLYFLVLILFVVLVVMESIRSKTFGLLIVFGPIFLIFFLFAFFKLRSGVKKLENYIITELK